MTFLRILSARLSDAGTYTCGGINPYNLSTTAFAIAEILCKYTLHCCLFVSKILFIIEDWWYKNVLPDPYP